MAQSKKFSIGEIGDAAFDAVSSGEITMAEYKSVVAAAKVIKKIL